MGKVKVGLARNRSPIPPMAPKAPKCPDLLELLQIYFDDKELYHARVDCWSDPTGWFLAVDLTELMPFTGSGMVKQAVLRFVVHKGKLWYTGGDLQNVSNDFIPIGCPEDPDLIIKMDGYIHAFLSGARALSSFVRGSLR